MRTWLVVLALISQAFEARSTTSCEHTGPVEVGDDIFPPILKNTIELERAWVGHVPPHSLPIRRAWLSLSYRADEQGVVKRDLDISEQRRPGESDLVRDSEDVPWLERLVRTSDHKTLIRAPGGLAGQGKDLRTAAYARLGELATSESLAAIRRIDHTFAEQANLSPAAAPGTTWVHPAWHFGDQVVRPIAEAETEGQRFAVVVGDLLGATDLFLISSPAPHNPATWSRPHLLPLRWYPGLSGARLEVTGPDRLTLRYTQLERPAPVSIMDGMLDRPPAPRTGPISHQLVLSEVTRDGDSDGWTDLEEARLGLDPGRRDSDGDGLVDGRDPCPNHPIARPRPMSDAQVILQRALFAVFSVGGSHTALLVQTGTTAVHVDGYRGPILYGINRQDWLARHGHGGVFVTWKIVRQDATEAVVEIEDWEGMLAAGGQNVFLRKVVDTWIVVARVPTWVS